MDREAVINLLMKGPEGVREFNRYRFGHEDEVRSIVLCGVDLARADLVLDGVNLSFMRLAGAKLRGTSLKKADFHGADLSGTDLRGTILYGLKLDGAELAGTRFDDSHGMKHADLERCQRETAATITFGD